MNQHLPALFGLAAALVSTPASLAQLNVVETTDFVGEPNPRSVFTDVGVLAEGQNTISGNLFQFDFDTIRVTLPAGHRIDTIDLVVSNHVDSPTSPTSLDYIALLPGRGLYFAGSTPGDAVIPAGGSAPWQGSYNMQVSHSGALPNASSDWEWQINVSVPAPGAAGVCALAGLAATRRRR